jgi:hypothetical protein
MVEIKKKSPGPVSSILLVLRTLLLGQLICEVPPLLENHFLVSLNFVITNFYLHQL